MAVAFDENLLEKLLSNKIRIAAVLVTVCFLFVFFRLYYLQILKGSKFIEQSTSNRIRVTTIPAPRGVIAAKTGEALVTNKPSFDLNLIPQDTPDAPKILDAIAALLQLPRPQLQKKVDGQKGRPPFEPATLKKDLAWEEMSLVLSKKTDLQGITIEVVPTRQYSGDIPAPHVVGFVGEIDRNELALYAPEDYAQGDLIGKFGLEKWGEQYLRGTKGGLQSEVDAYGNRQKILAEVEPVAGCNITVSIVPRVQRVAEQLLRDKPGAIVAMDPESGEILALASSPAFDANLFSRGIEAAEWKKLTANPVHPLLNRGIQSQQPPGSVFKIITAIAGLEEKAIDPHFTVFCPGYLNLGSRTFNCWKKHGHGLMDLHSAIVQSCDTYFYTVGMRVGVDAIHKYATMFGLGEKTGIELAGEKPGLIPSQEWKKKKYGYPWQKGETLNTAIGQGFVLCTPLQVATFFSGIANGAYVPRPHIVLAVDGASKSTSFTPSKIRDVTISKPTLAFIKNALAGVVNEPSGTASKARIPNLVVGGKTGTAQVIGRKSLAEHFTKIPWEYQDHAWFAALAPVEQPRIVVAVYVEHGGHGGSAAAPLAREIIASYLVPEGITKTMLSEPPRPDGGAEPEAD
jgi:penicillin-binding protein 2